METVERVEGMDRPAERPVQWWTGIQAALVIGALFLLVSRGILGHLPAPFRQRCWAEN